MSTGTCTTCAFMYYPALTVQTPRIPQGGPRTVPEHDLVALYSASYKSFHPLLKHLEYPENVATVVQAFDPIRLPQNLWKFVSALSVVFPQAIFPQLAHKIHATRDAHGAHACRGNTWVRARLKKDLLKCWDRLARLHDLIIKRIVASEESERDPRLAAAAYLVKQIMEWEGGSSVKELLDRLG